MMKIFFSFFFFLKDAIKKDVIKMVTTKEKKQKTVNEKRKIQITCG